jgi:hypothetical protein
MRRFLIIVCLFLLACGQQQPEGSPAFVGGSEGLRVDVIDGAPPAVVMDEGSTPFSVVVSLENIGEADVGPGTENPFVQSRLEGVKPSVFNLSEDALVQRLDRSLQGARRNIDGTILPGGVATLRYEGLSHPGPVVGSQTYSLRANVCYDYRTDASLKVCLGRDLQTRLQDASICAFRQSIEPQSSGGPLQVVRADQSAVGRDTVQVNFAVENVGNGVFFNRADDSEKACVDVSRNRDRFKALVVVDPVDPERFVLDCPHLDGAAPGFEEVAVPSGAAYGIVRFTNNAPRTVTCRLERAGTVDTRVYEEVMDVHVYYRYAEFLDVPVHVQEAQAYPGTQRS